MAKKKTAGPELGQRSISSMFSNSRITAGGLGNGRSVPLMEFLDRKLEKQTSRQGCIVDAGLTLAVKERLDSNRENDHRSKKRNENGDGIGQFFMDECSTLCYREVPHANNHRRSTLVNAESSYPELGKSIQEKPVAALVFNECRSHMQMAPRSNRDAGCDLSIFKGSRNPEGDLSKKEPRFESRNMDFIDLTEDEHTADTRVGDEVCLQEDCSEINRKRKRSQAAAADEATEMCPVCNDRFPREMLQAHVESELDSLEIVETQPVPQAEDSPRVEDGGVGARGGHGRFPDTSLQFKEPGINPRHRKTMLVLGDEPRSRRRVNVPRKNKRPTSSTFNHYADGGGWWDEGGVGVDAEAVGSASVWEGMGSMSFGGTL